MIKKELKNWLVFVILIVITVPLVAIGFKYIGMSSVWQSIISVIIGMLLMFASQVLVEKFWNKK